MDASHTMFRPTNGPTRPSFLLLTIGLLIAVIIATAATILLAVAVSNDQRALETIIEEEPDKAVEHLKKWTGERRWELISVVIDVLVLSATALALLLVGRAYRASQKSLHEVRRLAWDILASIDQAVVTSNKQGRITSINPMARGLLAIDDSAVGQSLGVVFDDAIPLAKIAQDVVESTESQYDRDFSVTRRRNTMRLRAEGHLLRDGDESIIGVVMYIRDITERMLLEDQMRRMERFMGLGTLAAGLHHEIKNPLSALSLHVQLLEESLDNNHDRDVGEHLGVLKTEITRINGVLEGFRDFASLATLKRLDLDLCQLLNQTAELIRPKAQEQHVELKLDLPSQPLPLIFADSARLEQVLLNLVLNSMDSMRQGGTLGLSLHQDNGSLRIDVTDTGTGIPENVQARIFDPYFTTKTDGSGMGLAVCDKVVQQHRGQIAFQTSPQGTVFQISLPLDSADGNHAPEHSCHRRRTEHSNGLVEGTHLEDGHS